MSNKGDDAVSRIGLAKLLMTDEQLERFSAKYKGYIDAIEGRPGGPQESELQHVADLLEAELRASNARWRFCANCSQKLHDTLWKHCPECGTKIGTL